MWNRIELKTRAKELFSGCRGMAIAVSLVLALLSGGGGARIPSNSNSNNDFSKSDFRNWSKENLAVIFAISAAVIMVILVAMVIGFVIRVFVSNPIEIGARRFFMVSRERTADFRELAFIFSNEYIKNALIMLVKDIFVFLWSLLFVIPGIIKSYEYRMIPYILAENPEIDRKKAFELSKRMMDGQKWDTFVLDLSFFPWALLSGITCGIVGVVYYLPYRNFTNAELYSTLRSELLMNDKEAAELLIGFGE